MTVFSADAVIGQLNWRYAVKKFDNSRQIPQEIWQALEDSMILAPSSYGLQPWKFVVITDESVKGKLPEASWNQQQPKDCSHMVVLAGKENIDAAYIESFLSEVVEQRQLPPNAMDSYRDILITRVGQMETHFDWNCRQVYIALAQLMTTAALLSVDTCPMEGIDTGAYDRILGLEGSGYRSVVGCACGYRSPEDRQAAAKKVRFSSSALVKKI